MRSNPGPPMTLANMRLNGVRLVTASCANCGRSADVNVDALPETLTVPEAGRRLRCSQCGAKTISTRPAWHTGTQRPKTFQTIGENGRRRPKARLPTGAGAALADGGDKWRPLMTAGRFRLRPPRACPTPRAADQAAAHGETGRPR